MVGASAGTFSQGIKEVETNYVVWKLVVNYACCFRVELIVNNSMSSYSQEQFDLWSTCPQGVALSTEGMFFSTLLSSRVCDPEVILVEPSTR